MDKNAATEATGGIVPVIDVHRRLRIARDIYNSRISQDDFGALIGASGNTVGNYETGAVTRLKDVYIRNWANVTGVDYWWIKTGHAGVTDDPTTRPGAGAGRRSIYLLDGDPRIDGNYGETAVVQIAPVTDFFTREKVSA